MLKSDFNFASVMFFLVPSNLYQHDFIVFIQNLSLKMAAQHRCEVCFLSSHLEICLIKDIVWSLVVTNRVQLNLSAISYYKITYYMNIFYHFYGFIFFNLLADHF